MLSKPPNAVLSVWRVWCRQTQFIFEVDLPIRLPNRMCREIVVKTPTSTTSYSGHWLNSNMKNHELEWQLLGAWYWFPKTSGSPVSFELWTLKIRGGTPKPAGNYFMKIILWLVNLPPPSTYQWLIRLRSGGGTWRDKGGRLTSHHDMCLKLFLIMEATVWWVASLQQKKGPRPLSTSLMFFGNRYEP